MRILRLVVRDDLAKLIDLGRCRATLVGLALLALVPLAAAAATSTAKPQPYPNKPMHATYTVEINKLGQVTRVRAVEPSKIPAFDAVTYGNALQAFVRTADGSAIAGVYKLTYDYSPVTKKIHRGVQLLQSGGVNADAPGAVTVELQKTAKRRAADAQHSSAPSAALKLPEFNQIVTPKPAATESAKQ
jgi:hypothetical protein